MSDDLNSQPQGEPNAGTEIPGERPAASGGEEIESRARAQGWVPKEEFRGDPQKWRDADAFVKRGEEELPILRERNRSMERKISEMEARQNQSASEYERRIANIDRMSQMALAQQRHQLERSYAQAMLDAGESGDRQRYFQLDHDRAQALQKFDQQAYAPQQSDQQQRQSQQKDLPAHQKAAVDTWLQKNEWFNRDPELNAVAQAVHVRIGNERPGMSLDENLAEVTKYVRQRYPEKFGAARSADPAVVESGGRMTQSSAGSKGAAALSAEERRVGNRFVKEGLFKNLDEYAKELASMN